MADGAQAPAAYLGRIDPSSLIGVASPVVEPRAVDQLSNAFRTGLITADDIVQRFGQRAQAREKAEVSLLAEQTSPEAIAARQAGQRAATATADLQTAQAGAALPLVQPAAALQQTALEEQQAISKYGPGVEYFKVLAPKAGVSAPVTPDGQPDYAKRAQIGLQLYDHFVKQEQARERLQVATTEKSADGTTLLRFNKLGELITPELEKQLSQQALTPFSTLQPGATAPAAAPAAATPGVTPAAPAPSVEQLNAARAALVNQGLPSAQVVQMTPEQLVSRVTAAPTQPQVQVEPAVPPVGAKTPAGISLGPAAPKQQKAQDDKAIAENLLAMEESLEAIQSARKSITSGNVVGPIAGTAPVRALNQLAAGLGIREQEFQSQDRLLQAINKKVLEGAQKLKGNLSDKDIRFLRESFPSLTSTEATWNDFLDKWEKMTRLNMDVLRGAAPKGSSIFDTAAAEQRGASAPSGQPTPVGPVREITGVGKVQRFSDGQYRRVQ